MEAPQVAAVGEVALPAAGTAATAATSEAAATAATSEAAATAAGDGKSIVAGGREAVRVELGTEVETVVPSEMTAIQAPAACNRAMYHAPRE